MGARCSWTGGRGNLARNCANLSCVFSRNVFVDSMSGECVPNWASLPIRSSHSRIDLLKSSSIALLRVGWRVGTAALVSGSAPGSLSWPAYAPSGLSVRNENAGGSDYCVRAAAARDNANRQPVFVLGRGGDFLLSIPGARTRFERRRLLRRRNTAGLRLLVSYWPLARDEREQKAGAVDGKYAAAQFA